jgi:predicted dehydrogenase
MTTQPQPDIRRGRTRRQFLGTCAGALAAPLFVPAAALGRGGFVPPSERINVGFIGVSPGGQSGGHLFGGAWTYVPGGYAGRDDVQVVAVCDVWRDRREAARKRLDEIYAARFGVGHYTGCAAYNDFRELLARADIDAVVISTPIHWHGVMAVMAAQAGKDIYCEKPTAITIRESQAMRAAVQRHGRVFQAGTQQRSEYEGKFRRACEIVRSGAIGKVREVYAFKPGGTFAWKRFGAPKPVPEGLDWDLYLGPAPWQSYGGVANAHMFCGVGDINWAPHHYDFIQWVLAADRSGPVELFFEKDVLQCRYANGVVVHACPAPEGGPGGSGGARFIGTDGWVAVDRDHIAASKPELLAGPLGPGAASVYHSTSHAGNFLACVRSRKQPICDIETAHRSASAVILGGLALTLKRTLKWDPQQEQFINDDEANRLLSTTFRSPWTP